MPFTTYQYLHPFQKFLRSKLKVVLHRAEFWTFFVIPNFKGVVSPKSCEQVISLTQHYVMWQFH